MVTKALLKSVLNAGPRWCTMMMSMQFVSCVLRSPIISVLVPFASALCPRLNPIGLPTLGEGIVLLGSSKVHSDLGQIKGKAPLNHLTSSPTLETHSRPPFAWSFLAILAVKKTPSLPTRASYVVPALASRWPQSPSSTVLALAHSQSEPPAKKPKKSGHKDRADQIVKRSTHQLPPKRSSDDQDAILVPSHTL